MTLHEREIFGGLVIVVHHWNKERRLRAPTVVYTAAIRNEAKPVKRNWESFTTLVVFQYHLFQRGLYMSICRALFHYLSLNLNEFLTSLS